MARTQIVNGVVVAMTPEEEAAFEAGLGAAIPQKARATIDIAMAELGVTDDYSITGIELSVGIALATIEDIDTFRCYFSTLQLDTKYAVFPQSTGFNIDCVDRQLDYFELKVKDRITNEPTTPSSFGFTVKRVI